MQCKNCGANYKTREFMCPYCSTENIIGKIWKIKRTEAELEYEKTRKELGKKYSVYVIDRILTRCIVVSILTILLIFLGVYAFFFVYEKFVDYRNDINKDNILETLDKYYEEKRFSELDEYMEKEGIRGDEYYPYTQVTSMNYYYQSYLNNKYIFLDMSDEEKQEDDYYMKYAIKDSIRVYTMDFGVLSELDPKNQEIYEEYKMEIESFWKTMVGLDDDDIEDIEYNMEENHYVGDEYIDEYVRRAKERFNEDDE